jgi:hypothetical protein
MLSNGSEPTLIFVERAFLDAIMRAGWRWYTAR